MGRGAQGIRRVEAGRGLDRRRIDRLEPRAAFAFQVPAAGGVRRAAAHRHRQNSQQGIARESKGIRMNLTVAREGASTIVTLNRPERRNALSLELMRELIACLDEIGRDPETRAVILAAAGKVFCSGHDLSQMTCRNVNEYREIFDVCSELMQK